jgi:hypothetical protein
LLEHTWVARSLATARGSFLLFIVINLQFHDMCLDFREVESTNL